MNRTPRSASRRASRQLAANEPSAPLRAVQVEHVLRLVARCPSAPARSSASGTPSRTGLMRVAISGSSTASSCMRLSCCTASTTSRCWSGVDARRVADVQHRVALRAELRRPGTGSAGSRCATAARRSAAAGRPCRCEVSTTKPGRSSALAAQAVREPRAHARPAGDRRAGVHERVGRVVVDRLGLQRADDADLVGDRADVREDLADLLARLAALLERDAAGRST